MQRPEVSLLGHRIAAFRHSFVAFVTPCTTVSMTAAGGLRSYVLSPSARCDIGMYQDEYRIQRQGAGHAA